MVRFSKFTSVKEIYEKLEEFLSKVVWRDFVPKKILPSFIARFVKAPNKRTIHDFNIIQTLPKLMIM